MARPDDEKAIMQVDEYSEDKTGSVWADESPKIIKLIDNAGVHGEALNLAAGDGRYNTRLLELADHVVAVDIDPAALVQLERRTPEELRGKLDFQELDLTAELPFNDASFDAVHCLGTLQLFGVDDLSSIFGEVDRIVRPGGHAFLSISTNVLRTSMDGSGQAVLDDLPQHELIPTIELMLEQFDGYEVQMNYFNPRDLEFPDASPPYFFSADNIFMTAWKPEE